VTALSERPLPTPTPLTQAFWDGVRAGRLLVPECRACGRKHFSPLPACPHCMAETWEYVESPGIGTVYSVTVVHRSLFPGLPSPFALTAVDLDDGWTLMTHVIGIPPDEVRIGLGVVFAPTAVTPEISLPTFRPA
jgi:uncharacterized OB-fold protein